MSEWQDKVGVQSVESITTGSGAWSCGNRADCNDWMCDLKIAKCCRLHLRSACGAVERPTEPVVNSMTFVSQLC